MGVDFWLGRVQPLIHPVLQPQFQRKRIEVVVQAPAGRAGDHSAHNALWDFLVPDANGQMLIGSGSAAASNFETVSLYMDSDYMNAQIYLRPTQIAAHPLMLFPPDPSNAAVQVIENWATMVQ